MKKIIIYTGLLLLGVNGVSAQSKSTAKADKYFDNLQYVDAISEYLEVIEDGNGDDYVYWLTWPAPALPCRHTSLCKTQLGHSS